MAGLRKSLLILLLGCFPTYGHAAPVTNKSIEGRYKTTAHVCVDGHCDDQDETLASAFFVDDKNVHVYSGANKGLVLPFGQRALSDDGKSVWLVPTRAGFDETYARDGFTITHHYAIRPDGTCSISVSVLKAPTEMSTTYKTDMESCRVVDGNMFAAR